MTVSYFQLVVASHHISALSKVGELNKTGADGFHHMHVPAFNRLCVLCHP
jgi:hypothetical protein